MQNNQHIVLGITFLNNKDLDVMVDLKHKLGNELKRCLNDKIMAIQHNEDLLQIIFNWADNVVSNLIKKLNIPELKLDSPKRKRIL